MHGPHRSTEQFQVFLEDWRESFWGVVQGKVRETLKKLLEADSEQRREEYRGLKWYERADSRNGSYERDYVTPVGVIRFRVRRTRRQSFLPRMLRAFERRAPEVAELIRQAFLRGIPTRGVGRVVALVTEEAVSAQTVSKLVKVLDRQGEAFHQRRLDDGWAYRVLDGVWMKVRRSWGPQRVLLWVAYGIRPNGERQRLAFQRAKGESQAGGEGFLNTLRERGLLGEQWQMIITDGGAGLAALETVYPRAQHPRCWVHKMRNLCEAVRRRDHDRVKRDAQAIYLAPSLARARRAFQRFQWNWQRLYPQVVKSLEKDLPERLNFYAFPKHLWRKLRTTNPSADGLLRGSPPPNPAHGSLHECPKRRPDYLCHLQPL